MEEQSGHNKYRFQRLFTNAQVESMYFTNENFTGWGSDLREEYEVFLQEEWEKVYQQYPALKNVRDVDEQTKGTFHEDCSINSSSMVE